MTMTDERVDELLARIEGTGLNSARAWVAAWRSPATREAFETVHGKDLRVKVLVPHTGNSQPMSGLDVVSAWLSGARRELRRPRLHDLQVEALEAAVELVAATRFLSVEATFTKEQALEVLERAAARAERPASGVREATRLLGLSAPPRRGCRSGREAPGWRRQSFGRRGLVAHRRLQVITRLRG